MSIETEKWTWDRDAKCVRDVSGYKVYVETLPEVAVLPDALVLLKELQASPGGVPDGLERGRDILRRAGVAT